MCTLELHHGGWFENRVYKKGKVCYLDNIVDDFLSLLNLLKIGRGLGYDVDISQVEQRLEIRCRNVEGGLELVTSDATVVEMVGHISSNKVIVSYYSEIQDYGYDADAENCDGDVTQNYQVKEEAYIEDEKTFENVRTKVANEDAIKEVPNEDVGAKLPNEDVGANVTIDDEGAELPNEDEDEDSEIKDNDYVFSENEADVRPTVGKNVADEGLVMGLQESENEAEVRPTIGKNVADEGTSHGAPREVSSDGANTSEFDTGSETKDEDNGRKNKKLPKFKKLMHLQPKWSNVLLHNQYKLLHNQDLAQSEGEAYGLIGNVAQATAYPSSQQSVSFGCSCGFKLHKSLDN
ncbi:hypothetical protein ACE6H2_026641 [Prunus campanulata]